MSRRFEELEWQETRLGPVSLRRRVEPVTGGDVYEVKLGDEFLMSSLFTVAEVEMSRLGLAAARDKPLDVLVGGLGLGYTAAAALDDPRVRTLTVVEALAEVIGWHERRLLPEVDRLTSDPRVTLLLGDFFAMVREVDAWDETVPGAFDVILLDVDHTPRHVLHPSHAHLYTVGGLEQLRGRLNHHGVFALWSDDPPDEAFTRALGQVFATHRAEVVTFRNPLTGGTSSNTVYVATS